MALKVWTQHRRRPASAAPDKTQTIGSKAAAALDRELMSTGGFSIDQLMELAGLAVSQAGMALQTGAPLSLPSRCRGRLTCFSVPRAAPRQGQADPCGLRSGEQRYGPPPVRRPRAEKMLQGVMVWSRRDTSATTATSRPSITRSEAKTSFTRYVVAQTSPPILGPLWSS